MSTDLGFFEWKEPGILRNIVYFLCVGIFAFVILFLKEFRVFEVLYYYIRMVYRAVFGILCKNLLRHPPVPENSAQTDEDVKYEKERINGMLPADYENYNMVLKNTSRYYKDLLAVNQLCLAVKNYGKINCLNHYSTSFVSSFQNASVYWESTERARLQRSKCLRVT